MFASITILLLVLSVGSLYLLFNGDPVLTGIGLIATLFVLGLWIGGLF